MGYNFEDKEKAAKAGASSSRKGVPNKTTEQIRDAYKAFIGDNTDKFQEWLDRVAEKNPAKAIELINGLSDYVLPKLQRTEIVGDEEKPLSIDLTKLDESTLKQLIKATDKGSSSS